MRQDQFPPANPKDRPDLSAEIVQSVTKEHNQRVTCTRVTGDKYRCNWWSPAPSKLYDNPQMHGLLVTTHVVTRSAFLNVVKVDDRLVVTDASAEASRT